MQRSLRLSDAGDVNLAICCIEDVETRVQSMSLGNPCGTVRMSSRQLRDA